MALVGGSATPKGQNPLIQIKFFSLFGPLGVVRAKT